MIEQLTELVAESAQRINVRPNVVWTLFILLAALTGSTIIRLALLGRSNAEKRRQRIRSLAAWWVLSALLAGAVLFGAAGAAVLLGIASLLGFREFLSLLKLENRNRAMESLAYWAIAVHYVIVALGRLDAFWIWLPVGSMLLITAATSLRGRTEAYIQAASAVSWSVLLFAFFPSHAAMLFALPEQSNLVAGNAGWFLYLILLTELNDIFQALWGRKLGRHKIAPIVSPNKTVEGFALGVLSTAVLSIVLAPLLTPWVMDSPANWTGIVKWLYPALVGLMIGVAGFLGDINESAIKRDAGASTTGELVAGQGGILDRIDSLTFTAPLFFYYVYWFET